MMNDFDTLRRLIEKDRSYRRFDQEKIIGREILEALVSLTRFCASGRNLQPLKYRIVNSPEECDKIFPNLAWAGYLPEWPGPEAGERPTAYLIQCLDTNLTENPLCDEGLQLQTLTLGAVSLGLGGCIIKSFNKKKIAEELDIPQSFDIRYVLALGVPDENVVIEDMEPDKSEGYKYYRTSDEVHHVPKRKLSDLII